MSTFFGPEANKSFVEYCADLLLETSRSKGSALENFTVVWPGKRAENAFLRALASRLDSPRWSPRTTTVAEFLSQRSTLLPADRGTLERELYRCASQVFGTSPEFSSWLTIGSVLLNDFNELDLQLCDPRALFKNLIELHALDAIAEDFPWPQEQNKLSRFQLDQLRFWEKLLPLYNRFGHRLRSLQCGYAGLISRTAAERTDLFPLREGGELWWCGFNALTVAEKKMLSFFSNKLPVKAIADIDEVYLKQEVHEAGRFLRSLKKQPWFFAPATGNFLHINADRWHVHELPGKQAQAQRVATLINQSLGQLPEDAQIGVVLGDESLLTPLLHQISDVDCSMNLSKGFDLDQMPLFSLFKQSLDLCLEPRNEGNSYQWLALFEQWLIYSQRFERAAAQGKLQAKSGQGILNFNELSLPACFAPNISPREVLERFIAFAQELENELPGNSALHIATLQLIVEWLNSTLVYCESDDIPITSLDVRQLLKRSRTDFTTNWLGSATDTVQIIGLLESRALDFRTVIFAGFNEEFIPRKSSAESFITQPIRSYFGLRTKGEQESVSAHHVYRLLHRSKEVHFLYTASDEDEPSRFLLQLQAAYPQRFAMHAYSFATAWHPPSNPKIKRNAEIESQLQKWLARGISPSALNKFISCPLDFYYRYLANLPEDRSDPTDWDNSRVGSILHQRLETYFKSALLKELTLAQLDFWLAEAQKKEKQPILEAGLDYVYELQARKFVSLFLQKERQNLLQHAGADVVLALEKPLQASVQTNLGTATFRGIADRIGTLNSVPYIFDYKTGKVQQRDVMIDEVQEVFSIDKPKPKALQLMLYAWMQFKETGVVHKAALCALFNANQYVLELKVAQGELKEEHLSEFELHLKEFLNQHILSHSVGFEHRHKAKHCVYCRKDVMPEEEEDTSAELEVNLQKE